MLDDLRNSADSSFYEEDPLDQQPERPQRRHREGDFLGMSAGQRFVIALIPLLHGCHPGGIPADRLPKSFDTHLDIKILNTKPP